MDYIEVQIHYEEPTIVFTSLKSYAPMILKMNYTSFKDLIEVWFNARCLYINDLTLNDFCEIFKCFIYSFC
jgi:hypothetical protein